MGGSYPKKDSKVALYQAKSHPNWVNPHTRLVTWQWVRVQLKVQQASKRNRIQTEQIFSSFGHMKSNTGHAVETAVALEMDYGGKKIFLLGKCGTYK